MKDSYKFCKGLEGSEKPELEKSEKHYARVRAYFESVKKQGFAKVWKQFPSSGLLLLDRKKISTLSVKEFFEILENKKL